MLSFSNLAVVVGVVIGVAVAVVVVVVVVVNHYGNESSNAVTITSGRVGF